jgi:hypothetical protein
MRSPARAYAGWRETGGARQARRRNKASDLQSDEEGID